MVTDVRMVVVSSRANLGEDLVRGRATADSRGLQGVIEGKFVLGELQVDSALLGGSEFLREREQLLR